MRGGASRARATRGAERKRVKATAGDGWVVGDGMAGRLCDVNQGDLSGVRESRAEVRALIVAKKRGNARGAKGRRKADAE